jgi:hypothetical protein
LPSKLGRAGPRRGLAGFVFCGSKRSQQDPARQLALRAFMSSYKVSKKKIGPQTKPAKIDPHRLFVNAGNFQHTIDALVNLTGDVRFGQPIVVLTAFASELFMKCLIVLEQKPYPIGHNLKSLFSKLGVQTRTKIENEWNSQIVPKRSSQISAIESEIGRKLPIDLPTLLGKGGNAFVDVRYAHEKQPTGDFLLQDLLNVLKETILEKKPAWRT